MATVTCVVALGIDTDLFALCCAFSTFTDICIEGWRRAKEEGVGDQMKVCRVCKNVVGCIFLKCLLLMNFTTLLYL